MLGMPPIAPAASAAAAASPSDAYTIVRSFNRPRNRGPTKLPVIDPAAVAATHAPSHAVPESIGCNQNADTKNRKPVDARSSIIAMAPIDSRGEWSCSSSSASGSVRRDDVGRQ